MGPDALVAAGTDLDATDQSGYTALHYAAMKDNPKIALQLMCGGARVGVRDAQGRTALHFAAACSRRSELVGESLHAP